MFSQHPAQLLESLPGWSLCHMGGGGCFSHTHFIISNMENIYFISYIEITILECFSKVNQQPSVLKGTDL